MRSGRGLRGKGRRGWVREEKVMKGMDEINEGGWCVAAIIDCIAMTTL